MLNTMDDLLQSLEDNSLKEHLQAGLELKEDWSQKHGCKLSALANKIGKFERWLVVGIDDSGTLVGKSEEWAKKTEEVISQHINEELNPAQACIQIKTLAVKSSWIIIINICNPGDVVYWGKDAYAAAGTTIIKMQAEDVLKLRMQLPGLHDYSKQSCESNYDESLSADFALHVAKKGVKTEFSEKNPSDGIQVLNKLEIYGKQVSRILFGACSYRVVKYSKDGEPLENKKFDGLFRLLGASFLNEIQDFGREQLKISSDPYPAKALKEALANAVAHAAYYENDGEILIELFADHVTISNLCVRDSIYFANRWFSRSHKTVNALLMEVMRVAGIVDELGRGKNLIFSESIRGGKRPPEVVIEKAGKFDRWKLSLYGGTKDTKLLKLLERSKAMYRDDQKALIAQALVLWRDKPVSEIREFVDGDFQRQFIDVLGGLEGPIFYYKNKDQIILRRWAQILIGEGKDSKTFSSVEEKSLRELAFDLRTRHHDGEITPKVLRDLAAMADTKSELSLSSRMLQQWESQGYIKRIAHGKYKFVEKKATTEGMYIDQLMKLFKKEN